ncbi:hypothetical protein KJZ71_04145 [Patescibacteria group bacterium]|nr:hypothetical protein [Patescibacteria group bacterium]MDL1952877.1 hypothetical protein [Candidatus Uhrbacteria bacterium UHB]RIL01111.1 MAG: hypothetical protein DCC77_01045 [Candidatus Uhrbacteria bacterium]
MAKKSPRVQTRILGEAAHAALGGARGMTSYVKCLYDAKYCRRYRLPRFVFAFDAILIVMMFAVAGLFVWILLVPAAPPTMSASFSAPEIIAAHKTPMAIHLRAKDGASHENVRLTWHLPPGVEVLSSNPPMNADGTIYLGALRSGETASSHVIARMFYPPGTQVRMGFTIESQEGGERREYVGGGERAVAKSALTAKVPDAFAVDSVPAEGAVIPVAVTNESDLVLPSVELRHEDGGSVFFPRMRFGDLEPGERRYAFLRLGTLAAPPTLSWSVFSASRELERGTWTSGIGSWPYPVIEEPLIARPHIETTVRATASQAKQALIVVQPLWENSVQTWPLLQGASIISLPAISAPETPVQEWFVFPVREDLSGRRELGPGIRGLATVPFPVDAQIRYTSDAGDQLGIGPHPPRAGHETRYWVFWTAGPFDGDVRNVRIEATLDRRVRATGLVAAPNGGMWSFGQDGRVVWTLNAFGAGSGLTKALFGFEIVLTPAPEDAGRSMPILGETRAVAEDAETGLPYDAVDEAVSTIEILP